jgi:hypothetical protein
VEVLDTITETIRPLGFDKFRQIVNEVNLPPNEYAAFLVNNMFPFLASPPARYNVLSLKQSDLERLFIVAVANGDSAINAAKLSILIEKLLVNLTANNQLDCTPELLNAIDNGVIAREQKAISGDNRELRYSGRRILAFRKMLKGCHQ